MAFLFFQDNRGHIRERVREFYRQKWLVAFIFYVAFLLTGTILARSYTNPFFDITGNMWILIDGKLNTESIINIIM